MSNAIAIAKPTRADAFIGQVLPPDRMQAVLGSLPEHVKPERFQRNLVVAITQHPRLLECDPVAVFNEVSKAAALGLYLDPQLGEAYLITGFSNGRYVPQLRTGYRGLIKLARQSGQVASVYAHEVCQNDKFKMTLGTDKQIQHEPDYQSERGDVGLYYAVVKFTEGDADFEPMSMKEIHRIRDRSDGWKAFKAGKIKSTPWGTDEGEMSKKTVLRRLLKRIPQSPELGDALRLDDEDYQDGAEVVQRPSLAARLSAAPSDKTGFSIDHVEIETTQSSPATGDASQEASLPESESQTSDSTNSKRSIIETGAQRNAGAKPLPLASTADEALASNKEPSADGSGEVHDRMSESTSPTNSNPLQSLSPQTVAAAASADAIPPVPPVDAIPSPDEGEKSSGDGVSESTASSSLPVGWGILYAAALRAAPDKKGLTPAARKYWAQYGGWGNHKDGPDAQTAIAIFDAFSNNFGRGEVIDFALRELI